MASYAAGGAVKCQVCSVDPGQAAFSKKIENHEHAIALHYMNYNYCRIHQSLRVTPAMAAGVTDRLWEVEDIVGLID